MIHNIVPESYHKVLQNIRKTTERAKKKKLQQREQEDSESEEGLSGKVRVET